MPAALARALDLDPATLTRTIDDYNRIATGGRTDPLGREPETMSPMRGRLYGLRLHPSAATTSGGPRRNANAQVLDRAGRAIPGLYAAGSLGSVWGHLTHHRGGLTDGLVFGRIAAETAAEEGSTHTNRPRRRRPSNRH